MNKEKVLLKDYIHGYQFIYIAKMNSRNLNIYLKIKQYSEFIEFSNNKILLNKKIYSIPISQIDYTNEFVISVMDVCEITRCRKNFKNNLIKFLKMEESKCLLLEII